MPIAQTGVLATIDWRRPWLAPFLPVASLVAGPDWRAALNRLATAAGLRNHRQLPLQFVPQTDLPEGVAYESYISQTGCVPTRENLHDFFNALVWLHYPQMKQVLNALQAHEIERAKEAGDQSTVRGKLRDGATIFDENAALIISANVDVVEALRAHRWQEALVKQAAAFGKSVEIVLFGHALMEKLVAPYKSITAHAWVLQAPETYFSLPREQQRLWLDQAAAALMGQGLSTQDFTPLPILGVPGWWADQDAGFYADVTVFRPQRLRKA
jgi:hypothetical protein